METDYIGFKISKELKDKIKQEAQKKSWSVSTYIVRVFEKMLKGK